MTYDEALAFWYGRVNYERKAPQPGDLKLDRMRCCCTASATRTSGCGLSTSPAARVRGPRAHMLASVLRHAGYRTGLFTSPHLSDVRERIEVDGTIISRDDLATLMSEVKPAVEDLEAAGDPPTFFEVGTAVGFLHFLRCGCDIAVIEVGLGGRFDSTNVLTPLVSVITSISLDHTQMLGETVEQIAFEKAGIIKPGVPVVNGVTEPGPQAVIEGIAVDRGARLVQSGVDFELGQLFACIVWEPDDSLRSAFRPSSVEVQTRNRRWVFDPGLAGRHQAANAALVIAAVERLLAVGFDITEDAVRRGMAEVHWPARFELFDTQPRAVLDCAHNVASAIALVDMLSNSWLGFTRRDHALIFAVSNDKDVPGMFRVLVPHFQRFYLTRYRDSSRAVPPEQLAAMLPAEVERGHLPDAGRRLAGRRRRFHA